MIKIFKRFFIPSLTVFYTLSTCQFRPATYQGLSSHLWLMAAICDSANLELERTIVRAWFQGQMITEGQTSSQACFKIHCCGRHVT